MGANDAFKILPLQRITLCLLQRSFTYSVENYLQKVNTPLFASTSPSTSCPTAVMSRFVNSLWPKWSLIVIHCLFLTDMKLIWTFKLLRTS